MGPTALLARMIMEAHIEEMVEASSIVAQGKKTEGLHVTFEHVQPKDCILVAIEDVVAGKTRSQGRVFLQYPRRAWRRANVQRSTSSLLRSRIELVVNPLLQARPTCWGRRRHRSSGSRSTKARWRAGTTSPTLMANT